MRKIIQDGVMVNKHLKKKSLAIIISCFNVQKNKFQRKGTVKVKIRQEIKSKPDLRTNLA